jgi:2-phospho-L-lactate/phosphoenolpyruvate guanylyltransferase
MRTCAVLPVKRFDDAKQRLDRTLNAGTRRALAEAMVSDVLHGLRRAQGVDKVIVVTGESGAEALARAYDAESIPDDDRGHSHAARSGVDWALERAYDRVLLVPGDCPALDPNEVDDLVRDGMSAPDVVIVPDRHGEGTNALLLAPPDVIAPSFGPGSRARHEQAAEAAGARWRIAEPRSLVLDVDTAEDLAALRAALDARTGGAAHTRGLLARLDRRPPSPPPKGTWPPRGGTPWA